MVTVPSRSWVIFAIIKSAESRVHAAAEIPAALCLAPGEFVSEVEVSIELLPELFDPRATPGEFSDLAGPGGWPWS